MPREKRVELIKKIQEKRSSMLICYILGDRPPLVTNIADDAVRILDDHLESIGRQEQIDLFLYTRGGNLIAPYRIVHLIREFCNKFNVIVPYRALSAGTLLSLGANEIVMGKMGELSPVDPTTGHPFNPPDPMNPGQRIPISVEDVTSFMTFARKRASLSEEKDIDVFRILTSSVHPLALGNIERGYGIIRHLAPKLLEMHIKDKEKIKNIVESLTEGKVHEYLITRDEAKNEIGLNIKFPDEELESLIWSLYSVYEQDMELREPFDPVALLGDQPSREFRVEGAYVESVPLCDAFVFKGIINSVGQPMISLRRPPLPTQPATVPAEAPPGSPASPPERPTVPQMMLPLLPPQATVTFTFRGWKRITQETGL